MRIKALFLALTVVFLLACGVSSEQLTATAAAGRAQTQTAAPTRTPTRTPTPTSTPRPTSTSIPTRTPEPTPAAVKETVKYNDLEITLLKVITHAQIIVYSYHYYDAKDGYTFIDLMILVRNRGDNAGFTTLGKIYVIDKDGNAWYPFCGGFQAVELEKSFDPMTIIKWDQNSKTDVFIFEAKKDTYLRLFWPVLEHQDIVFGIEDSPQFTFSVK